MMLEVTDTKEIHQAEFVRFEKDHGSGPAWLRTIRNAAIARFGELGFPTSRHEDWRYTNVSALAEASFRHADLNGQAFGPADLAPTVAWDQACHRLVFVNGRFVPQLSATKALPGDVTADSLSKAIAAGTSRIEANLARHAKYADQPFVALNTAFLHDGAWIHVPKGVTVETPVHVVFVNAPGGSDRAVTHPRCLVVADERSQLTLVETHLTTDGAAAWTNAVSEIVIGENASVDHYRLVGESSNGYHTGCVQFQQHRSSTVSSYSVPLSGRLIRNDLNTVLDGEGGHCTLNGLYVLDGKRHADHHLRVEHAKPHCDSREYFKGVLSDASHGVFSGRIIVHKDAQKTDAKQTNMNLLLSEEALVDTKPQLEILADDVKCTHGATIGQIDDDALFYLRSRGLNREAARNLLVYAFARESTDQVKIEPLRRHLEDWLLTRLPHGELLRENL